MVVHYVVIAPRRTSSSQPDCSCPLVSRGSASPLALQILVRFGLVYLVCLGSPPHDRDGLVAKAYTVQYKRTNNRTKGNILPPLDRTQFRTQHRAAPGAPHTSHTPALSLTYCTAVVRCTAGGEHHYYVHYCFYVQCISDLRLIRHQSVRSAPITHQSSCFSVAAAAAPESLVARLVSAPIM